MIKMTPTQLSILAAANDRKDGGLSRPSKLRPANAASVATKLIEAGLAREIRTKADLPIWRVDDEGKSRSLIILKAGRTAVRSNSESSASDAGVGERHEKPAIDTSRQEVAPPALGRPGSKRALIVGLLQRTDGVTIKDLMAATGWLPHTTRAALTGLRKAGLTIDRCREAGSQGSIYRLASTEIAEAA